MAGRRPAKPTMAANYIYVLRHNNLLKSVGSGIYLYGQVGEGIAHKFILRVVGNDNRIGTELARLLYQQFRVGGSR